MDAGLDVMVLLGGFRGWLPSHDPHLELASQQKDQGQGGSSTDQIWVVRGIEWKKRQPTLTETTDGDGVMVRRTYTAEGAPGEQLSPPSAKTTHLPTRGRRGRIMLPQQAGAMQINREAQAPANF